MQRKNSLRILLLLLLATVLTNTPKITKASPAATLSVDPIIVTDISAGNTFTVNFTIAEVVKLWAYQIYLKYNTTVLTATSFENLADHAYTTFTEPEYSAINDTAGYVVIAYHSFMGDHAGFTPETTVPLASVTFQVDAAGSSKLELGATAPLKTVLADVDGNALDPAWNLVLVNGHFSNVGEILLHDITVTKVEASPTEVKPTETVSIAVTVKNNGAFNETFSVSTYYGGTHKIQTLQVVNLAPGASQSLTFTWSTAGIDEGSYVVSAHATVTTEDKPTDNTLSGNTVTIRTPGGGIPTIWYIVGGIAVVIVVAVVVYMLRARKK